MTAKRWSVVLVAGALTLAACGGGGSDDSSDTTSGDGPTSTTAPSDDLAAQCPVDALDDATKPVEITYWHAMVRANEETLKQLTNEFNASQDEVKVTLVNQNAYRDNLTKFKTVAGTDDAPDLIQLEDIALQIIADSQSTVPAAACIASSGFDTSDMVPRVIEYYSVNGALQPVPFNVSNPVFYYNKAAFRDAGLDPEQPPTTLDEVQAAAKKIQDSGYEFGFSYKRDSWVLEQFLALNGEPYVNNDNGRSARATEAIFDTDTARDILTQINDMVNVSKVASTNASDGPAAFDNLLAMCRGESAMTIDTSAALGTAYSVLASGGCAVEVEVGVAPLPVGNGEGGVLVGGAANYLPKKDDPAKLAAAWTYSAFLASPEAQATWAAGTGYIPVSQGATELPAVQDLWAESPGYKVAYDQLTTGKENVATAGPVIGGYIGVRDAIDAMLDSILLNRVEVDEAVDAAKEAADAAIAEYNDQI